MRLAVDHGCDPAEDRSLLEFVARSSNLFLVAVGRNPWLFKIAAAAAAA